MGEALNYLIRNSFNKLGYLAHLSANPQAEIKAVHRAIDVDDLGFSLEAGQGNQQALTEVEGHVNLMAGANRQVVLQDLVEDRFGRRLTAGRSGRSSCWWLAWSARAPSAW